MFNLKYKIMEVLLNLQNKNVTLNAVHVAPEGTNCCNRLKVHFDVFQETAKKAAIIRLSTANSFELIHYQDKHIALLIPFEGQCKNLRGKFINCYLCLQIHSLWS
jgi:hypothetical protein